MIFLYSGTESVNSLTEIMLSILERKGSTKIFEPQAKFICTMVVPVTID